MSQALYRRYRPERFADLVGQEHVTEPLQQALSHDRVNHAYLFSGPRGCGKTTSARILARCLNCEQGPAPEPCGTCQSCRDLARGGPGSIDVIEIDAASHGGVDDARDLRERAFYAPVSSRYKIYIIDEAHMVSTQGFNALLKLVEEPPPHIKFVFATTEPDKVIGTIRSRTHHYPFRLVPSRLLQEYLAQLCEEEGITVEPGVLPLVVRAGAGSVRDSLSVLDQLIGGSAESQVTYNGAVRLLGYTPAALLDEYVDAVAAGDGAEVFRVVEVVIDSGQDPRRFLEDVMQRLRDLVIVASVQDAFSSRLLQAPDDQQQRMTTQADRLGLSRLTAATDLVAAALKEMRGATAPRLQLELVSAKLLIPAGGGSDAALATRLDRLERRLQIGGGASPAPSEPKSQAAPAAPPRAERPTPPAAAPVERSQAAGLGGPAASDAAPARPAAGSSTEPNGGAAEREAADRGAGEPTGTATLPGEELSEVHSETTAGDTPRGRLDVHEVRRLWPAVLDRVKVERRMVWMMLFEKSQVLDVDARQLTLGLTDAGSAKAFAVGGKDEIVRQAVIDVLGLDVQVVAVHDPGGRPTTAQPQPAPTSAAPTAHESAAVPPAAAVARAEAAKVDGPVAGPREAAPSVDDTVDADDPDVDGASLAGHELVSQELGGTVIGEIEH